MRSPTRHFVLDIETTSRNTDGAIFSIACVQIRSEIIDEETVMAPDIDNAFSSIISIPKMLEKGAISNPDTEWFWKTVGTVAKQKYHDALVSDIEPIFVYRKLFQFIENNTPSGMRPIMWSRNMSFTFPTITNNLVMCHDLDATGCVVLKPWIRSNERDIDTIVSVLGRFGNTVDNANPHDALSDAIYNAETLISIDQNLPCEVSMFR